MLTDEGSDHLDRRVEGYDPVGVWPDQSVSWDLTCEKLKIVALNQIKSDSSFDPRVNIRKDLCPMPIVGITLKRAEVWDTFYSGLRWPIRGQYLGHVTRIDQSEAANSLIKEAHDKTSKLKLCTKSMEHLFIFSVNINFPTSSQSMKLQTNISQSFVG